MLADDTVGEIGSKAKRCPEMNRIEALRKRSVERRHGAKELTSPIEVATLGVGLKRPSEVIP